MGVTLYNKIINNYNKKMWQVDDNKKIDTFKWSPKGATIKDGPRVGILQFLHILMQKMDMMIFLI